MLEGFAAVIHGEILPMNGVHPGQGKTAGFIQEGFLPMQFAGKGFMGISSLFNILRLRLERSAVRAAGAAPSQDSAPHGPPSSGLGKCPKREEDAERPSQATLLLSIVL